MLLGGTTGATKLAARLATAGVDAVFSYAGRVDALAPQPLPTRVGGFGGADGFAAYLKAENITHVVDATHPFAVQMSRNAVKGAEAAGVAICALERPSWVASEGDNWIRVPNQVAAIEALPSAPSRIFLAIGRRGPVDFVARPEHWYLLRVIDPGKTPLPIPSGLVVEGRPPFTVENERALLETHQIELIVAKNSGGIGGWAKLQAARGMGLPVILIDRPVPPDRQSFADPGDVMTWLGHEQGHSTDLGV